MNSTDPGPAFTVHAPSNARDLAGWPTTDGALRPGRLRRGALHQSIVPGADARKPLHVVDLRSHREGTAQMPAGICAHRFPLHDPEWAEGAERTPEFYVASALRLIDHAGPAVCEVLHLLAAREDVFVGCRLGKDRTGLVILLIGVLLGVERNRIVNDYLETARVYGDAREWILAYARSRHEDPQRLRRRLCPDRSIPEGILGALPPRKELLDRLNLNEAFVHAARRGATAI